MVTITPSETLNLGQTFLIADMAKGLKGMIKNSLFLKTVISLVVVFFISSGAYAKKEIKKAGAFRIKLNVSASGNFEKEIRESVANELTSRNDIVLVENNAEYELLISSMETRIKDIPKPHIILSVTVFNPFAKDVVDVEQLLTDMNPFQASYMRKFFSNARVLLDHQLKFVEPDKLTSTCQAIVADFDNKYLEKTRTMFRRTHEKKE